MTGQTAKNSADGFGVYVHFPFCLKRCPYCDFATAAVPASEIPRARYADAIIAELRQRLSLADSTSPGARGFERRPVTSIYFGGGTPSLWGATHVAAVIAAVHDLLPVRNDCEVTLEANPGTLGAAGARRAGDDAVDLTALREAGVNRLSLGVQSLDQRFLTTLGRNHDVAEALEAVRLTRAHGFNNLSIDLMFALPGQSLDDLRRDVAGALAAEAPHISLYHLTYEPGTEFTRRRNAGELAVASDDLSAEMFQLIHDELTAAGYEHYEVSNLARPGWRARHNSGYWRMEPYLGLGVGAHGDNRRVRYGNVRNTPEYFKRIDAGVSPEAFSEDLDAWQRACERLMLSLRVDEGLRLVDLETALPGVTATAFANLRAEIATLTQEGFLTFDGATVRATPRGFMVLDALVDRLSDQLPDAATVAASVTDR